MTIAFHSDIHDCHCNAILLRAGYVQLASSRKIKLTWKYGVTLTPIQSEKHVCGLTLSAKGEIFPSEFSFPWLISWSIYKPYNICRLIWTLTHPKLCKILLYMYANELCYENKKHTWLTSSFEKTAEQSLVKCLSLDSRLFNDVVQETIFGTSDSFGTFWLLNFLTSKCGRTLGAGPGRSSSPCCKSTNQLGTYIPGRNQISTA